MTEVFVPRESVNDDTVIVQRVFVSSGVNVDVGTPIVELETSKTSIELTAPTAGRVSHNLEVGDEIAVGASLFRVGDDYGDLKAEETMGGPDGEETVVDGRAPSTLNAAPPLMSRAAAAVAAGNKIDLSRFAGRWVTTADLKETVAFTSDGGDGIDEEEQNQSEAALRRQTSQREQLSIKIGYREFVQSKRKRIEVNNLVGGMHFATTSCVGIRVRLRGKRFISAPILFENGISDLIVYESARLLRKYPELNGSYLSPRANAYYDEINFGISFDNGQNLKVVTLRSADRKPLGIIQAEFMELLELYEAGKPIARDLLETSTVTLSDLTGTEASYMLPLLNGRQSLILGVVRHSQSDFEIFASFDHRLSEGLRVARFLEQLRDRLVSHHADASGVVRVNCEFCGKSMSEEVRLGSRGFVKILLPSGVDASVCRNCFEGR